jgi:hypothetical protein
MKKLVLLSLVLFVGLAFGAYAQDDEGAQAQPPQQDPDQALLGGMDFQRFGGYFNFQDPEPATSFSVDITAERLSGTKLANVQVSFKIIEGQFFARIDYLSPEELKDDVFVITPEGIFFWNPDLDEPIVVPGTFEVFGDATVSEVVGIQFAGQYAITGREEITLENGNAGLSVDLEGTNENVAFPFATVVAELLGEGEEASYRPLTLELFGLDRTDPFHFNTFEEYADLEGRPYFKRQLLDNLITVENKTLLDVSDIKHDPLDDSAFDPTQLGLDN